ncbi:MAG: hypothetical protein GX882_01010 [Methanomicrobiales archaeon]|nr:hypothetical protein [Methanomicrobiales archaeon]
MKAVPGLEDGTFAAGRCSGARGIYSGGRVFSTRMAGYMEALADPGRMWHPADHQQAGGIISGSCGRRRPRHTLHHNVPGCGDIDRAARAPRPA